ncbi:MAG TPA: alpha/beta hydrolase [Acidimicrobiales bacterium]|nr:alpha/beta hydrolase [Acidimicrobiales bacterium]
MVADVHGAGPPVVLLHGQPGSAADWASVTPGLEAKFTVMIPDRPGYGRTGGRAQGFRANAAAVVGLLDRLNVGRATIVGHSWSGAVAIAMAEDTPDRVAGLVLVASVGPLESLGPLDRALAIPPIGSAVAAVTLNVAGRALSFSPVRQLLERRLRGATDDALVAMTNAWRQGDVWRSFVIEQRALVDELHKLAPGLSRIAAPTAVLVGEADHIVPADTGARLAAAIPNAHLIRLHGAGHLLPHEQPDAIVGAINEVAAAP